MFAYLGDFSLHMRSFDHILTPSLQSDIIFEFRISVLGTVSRVQNDHVFVEKVFPQKRGHFGRATVATPFPATFCDDNVRACAVSKSTSARKVITRNEFSNSDVLHHAKILAV